MGVIKYAQLMTNKCLIKLKKEWSYCDRELVDEVFSHFEGRKSSLNNVKKFENFEVVCVCAEALFEINSSIQLYNLVCRVLKEH